jgi:hypothetical protein
MAHNVYRYAQRLSLTRTHNVVKNVCIVKNTPRGTDVIIVTVPLSGSASSSSRTISLFRRGELANSALNEAGSHGLSESLRQWLPCDE